MPMNAAGLNGRAILVVEAESQVAECLEAGLRDAGARVFGVKRLKDALHMAQHPSVEAAIVAQKLGHENTGAVCRQLTDLGIPFMFHTRYDSTEARRRWPHAPVVNKPGQLDDIVRKLTCMLR
jgi:DNA-binding response OmpR family regulator